MFILETSWTVFSGACSYVSGRSVAASMALQGRFEFYKNMKVFFIHVFLKVQKIRLAHTDHEKT